MADPDSASVIRLRLQKELLESRSAGYAELTRIIGVLEEKAQKAAISAGALLALGVPLLKRGSSTAADALNAPLSLVLFFAVLLFVAAFCVCLAVMWVREAPATPQMKLEGTALDHTLKLGDDELSADREVRLAIDRCTEWAVVLKAYSTRVESKSGRLRWAQGLLAAGVLVLASWILVVLAGNFL